MSTIKSLRFDISSSWDGSGMAQARAELDSLKRQLDEINGKSVSVKVNVDATAAKAALADIEARIKGLSNSANVRVNADTAAATAKLDALKAKADSLSRQRVNINANANTAGAMAHLDELRVRTAALSRQRININVNVNAAGALAHLDELRLRSALTGSSLRRAGDDGLRAGDDIARLGSSVIGSVSGLIQLGGSAGSAAGSLGTVGSAATTAGSSLGSMSYGLGLVVLAVMAFVALAPVLAASVALIPLAFMGVAGLLITTNAKLKKSFSETFQDGLKTLLTDAMPLINAMLKGLQELNGFMKEISPEIKQAFAAAAPLVKPFVDIITHFVQGVLPGFTSAMQHMGPLIDGLAQGFGKFGGMLGKAVDIMAKTPGLGQAMNQALGALGNVFVALAQAISKVIAANPQLLSQVLNAIATVIRLITPLLVALSFIMSGFAIEIQAAGKGAEAAWNGMKAAGQAVGSFFAGPFVNFFKTIGSFFSGPFLTPFKAIATFFSGPFLTPFKTVGAFFSGPFLTPFKAVGTFFSGPFVKFFTDVVPKIVSAIGKWVTGAATAVANFTKRIGQDIGKFFSGPFLKFFTDVVPKIASAIGKWTTGAATAVANFTKRIGQDIGKFFSGPFVRFFTDAIPKMAGAIGKWAAGVAGKIADFFSKLGSDVAKGIATLVKDMLKGGADIAKALFDGLVNGLKSGVGKVESAAKSVGSKILGGLKNVLKIFSPSQATHQMGLDLNEGLGQGLDVGAVRGITAAAQVGIKVINALKTSFQNMQHVGMDAMQLLIVGFQFGMASLLNIVQAFGPRLTQTFTTMFQQVRTTTTTAMNEIVQEVRTGLTQMDSQVKSSTQQIKTTWTSFVNSLKTEWTSGSNSLKTAWTTFWNQLKTTLTTALNAIKTQWTTFLKTFQTEMTSMFSSLNSAWQNGWNQLKTSAQTIWDAMKTAWTTFGTDINTIWKNAADTLNTAWKTAWQNLNTEAQSGWNTIVQTIGNAVNKIIGIVNGLIKAWNAVASAVDLPSISAVSTVSFAEGGVVGYGEGGAVGSSGGVMVGADMAVGGVLPGYEPGRDTVPAMLSKGEGVLVPEAVKGLGEDFVHGANHHFSGGRAGRPSGHFSGGRQHFADGGVAGITTGAFGLPDPNSVKKVFDAIAGQFSSVGGFIHPVGEKFAGVAKQMEQKLIQAIQAKIAAIEAAMAAQAAAAGAQGIPGGAVGNLTALVKAALAKAGYAVTAANISAMLTRIMIESSGNPNAINNWDINAIEGHPSEGLAQITTTNFAIYGSGNILNPMDNLVASLNYISAVYGGNIPTGAAYASGTNNATRGFHLVGEDGPEMRWFDGGESVMPADQTSEFLSGGGSSGGVTFEDGAIRISISGPVSPETLPHIENQLVDKLRQAVVAGVGTRRYGS